MTILRHELLQLSGQRRQVVLNRAPQDGRVDIPVMVDGEVPHVTHEPPRDLRGCLDGVRRDLTRRFPDCDEIAHDRIDRLAVGRERVRIQALDIRVDRGDRVQDIGRAAMKGL